MTARRFVTLMHAIEEENRRRAEEDLDRGAQVANDVFEERLCDEHRWLIGRRAGPSASEVRASSD